MTPDQSRAARAMAKLSQAGLAEEASVAKATIAAFESGKRTPHPRTFGALVDALRRRGVEITDDGVRRV